MKSVAFHSKANIYIWKNPPLHGIFDLLLSDVRRGRATVRENAAKSFLASWKLGLNTGTTHTSLFPCGDNFFEFKMAEDAELAAIRQRRMAEMQAAQVNPSQHFSLKILTFCYQHS